MTKRVAVRCTRRCLYGGEPVEPGAVITVDPLAAWDALNSLRWVLVDDTQRSLIDAAVHADNARKCGRVPAQWGARETALRMRKRA